MTLRQAADWAIRSYLERQEGDCVTIQLFPDGYDEEVVIAVMKCDRHNKQQAATKRIAELEGERDGWIQSAKEFSDGVEYYRGIVDQIGNLFGVVARTADDGSVYDSVLRAKVFDLVSQLIAANVDLREALTEAQCYIVMYRDELPSFYGPWSESDAAEIAKDLGSAEAALANTATTEALERVRKEAKIDALESLAVHQRVRIVPASRSNAEATTETYVRWDAISAKAAELRGGE